MEKLIEDAKKILKEKNIYGDIYIENTIKNEIIVNDSRVEKITKSNGICGNVRVFKDGKMGFCYFAGTEKNILNDAVLKAMNSVFVDGYENYNFNSPNSNIKINFFDALYNKLTDDKRIEKAILLEKVTKENPFINMVRDINWTDVCEKTYYINSENKEDYKERTKFFIYTSAIAERKGNRELAESVEITTKLQNIDVVKTGRECAKKAKNLLNGEPIKTGKYKIMLPPEVACDLLALLSKIFLGSNIVKGKSLLGLNKTGDAIASDILNIKDDALLDFGYASFTIDAEGEMGQNKYVIKNGILKTFLFDKINAHLKNTNTTGNSIRQDFKFLPDCGVSNFYIEKGNDKKANIMNNFYGIYINSLMGLHMVDTVSGNFSLAFNGWLINRGNIDKAVKESLLTGNLKELLKKIIIICDDLKFYANYGSPTIVIDDMDVAGK
jgi:PmbA protein